MLCSMHIYLSKLEWIFGFHNVTLEAVSVEVSYSIISTCCSEDFQCARLSYMLCIKLPPFPLIT